MSQKDYIRAQEEKKKARLLARLKVGEVVEGVISQIKLFNAGSGWRPLTCVLVYVYAYAIGYSYYRRGELEV